jgi:serine/threonine-protein kinase ULK/ATG1
VKKLLQLVEHLKTELALEQNTFSLEYWDSFVQTRDYRDIQNYIAKEYEVFKTYFNSLLQKMALKAVPPEIA